MYMVDGLKIAKVKKKYVWFRLPDLSLIPPPPYINFFFSKSWRWKSIAEQNSFVLLFSSKFQIWRKDTYQNDHLKRKSKFLCIRNLVLEEKGLKPCYFFKSGPFYISFVLFHTFQSRSEYSSLSKTHLS